MNNECLHMGKSINTHFGFVEMPSQILEVGIFDDHLEMRCEDGHYVVTPNEGVMDIKKVSN